MTKCNNDDPGNGEDDGIRLMRVDLVLVHFLSGIVKNCIIAKPIPSTSMAPMRNPNSINKTLALPNFLKVVDMG